MLKKFIQNIWNWGRKMKEKIDFVITWVDGSDPKWLEDKNKYADVKENDIDSSIARYRNWEFLKYWFRSIEKNAPWVNKIFFVTYGHIPKWLNVNNKKLVIVKHEDFIPKKFLPTFNSCTIEMHLHRIKGLSEKFVYFNDDIFINKKVTESYFFKKNLPLDNFILSPIHPCNEASACIHYNCMRLINKYFNFSKVEHKKIFSPKNGKYLYKNITLSVYPFNVGLRFHHVAVSYLKSTFKDVWEKEEDYLNFVSSHKFRENTDVSQWLFQFWQLAKNNYEVRKTKEYRYYDIEKDFNSIIKDIEKSKRKMICLNDNNLVVNFEQKKKKLLDTFENKYKDKSNFEI